MVFFNWYYYDFYLSFKVWDNFNIMEFTTKWIF